VGKLWESLKLEAGTAKLTTDELVSLAGLPHSVATAIATDKAEVAADARGRARAKARATYRLAKEAVATAIATDKAEAPAMTWADKVEMMD